MDGTHDAIVQDFGVFHMPSESTLRDVGEHISRLEANRFREIKVFAYIFGGELQADVAEAAGVLHYGSFRSIFVVDRCANKLRLRRIVEDGLSEMVPAGGLKKIRESDLMEMMLAEGSACVMEPGGNYHFVTPSLMHTNRFLRIGDLIRNRETLDRLVFWIDEFVAGAQGLLIDSWSIASLGLRAMQKCGVDIPFDCLSEHPAQDSETCRSVVEKLLSAMPREGKLLVLVSISGSGRLLEQIKAIADDLAPATIKVVFLCLYGFKSTPAEIECIARIDDKDGTYSEAECKFCKDGSLPIPINPASYQLRSWREELVMTGQKHFIPGKDLLDRYHDIENLFFVHRDDPNDQRHHAFDIDVSRLLEVGHFRNRLIKLIRGIGKNKDLIVTPSHATAAKLLAITVEVLGIPAIVHDNLDGTTVDPTQRSQLTKAQNLLILDDAINSGTRLARYIQSLREGGYGDFESVDCLVAIARPETELELRRASRSIADRHSWSGTLHYGEMLLLPRWSERTCPWCKEFDLLSRLEELYPKPPCWLVQRNQMLASRRTGISDDPFLLLPGVTTPRLGSESVLATRGVSAEKVIFGVASALQRHRIDPDQNRQLHPSFPLANVLDPELFSKRFTEGLIRAAILRTTTRHELGSQANVRSRDFLLNAMCAENQQIVAGEMLAAIGRKDFSVISAAKFASYFEQFLPALDVRRLTAIIQLPQPIK